MAFLEDAGEIHSVHGLTNEEKKAIYSFLQGAVYYWCKNKPNEWFALRDLCGGENYYWQGTPLIQLYNLYEDVEQGGKAAGRMLKKVINDDKRIFNTKIHQFTRQYLWIKNDNKY